MSRHVSLQTGWQSLTAATDDAVEDVVGGVCCGSLVVQVKLDWQMGLRHLARFEAHLFWAACLCLWVGLQAACMY